MIRWRFWLAIANTMLKIVNFCIRQMELIAEKEQHDMDLLTVCEIVVLVLFFIITVLL